jgi:hypothetical protein
MLGFRVDVYDGKDKIAEVQRPVMAFGLLEYAHQPRVMCKGKVLYNVVTDGPVADINQWARIIAPRYNEIRFGTTEAA